jgi:hypothetical protein
MIVPLCVTHYLVYNQVRGFKTRHANSSGVGGTTTQPTTSSTRMPNDFDGYRLSVGSSGRHSQYSNDPNQPPLTALVNRVNKSFFLLIFYFFY